MELFQLLRDGVPRTRAQLAKSTGLARSTIAARVEELMRMGLIMPVADAASTGGRPPSQFALNPSARVVLAVDIGASHATVAVMDLTGAIRATRTESLAVAEGPERVLTWVIDAAGTILEEADEILVRWAEVAEAAWRDGRDIATALDEAFADDLVAVDEGQREKLETLNGVHSNAAGFQRWLETRERPPEA